jgi:hypothetical protein
MSPTLPFITARSVGDTTVQILRAALAGVFGDDTLAPVRERLLLAGVDLQPAQGYGEVLRLERGAVEQGYPIIC